jgi:ribose/xylose/arabinose/galactoside ABC-type transport system permease subunit
MRQDLVPDTSDSAASTSSPCPAKLGRFLREQNLLVILAVLVIVSSWASPVFFTVTNLMNLARQASYVGIISVGMTYVALTGGLDLSVGAVVAFSGVFLAYLFHYGIYSGYVLTLNPMFPTPVIVVLTLLTGAIFGFVNGFLVAKMKLAPFVVTLGTMVAARGMAYSLAGGRTIFGIGPELEFLGTGFVGRVPVPVIIWLGAAIVAQLVLRFTIYGRRIYAVGGEEEAARLSGIEVDWYKISAYVVSGLMAALVGILMAARIDQGEPRQGEGYELDAIAAVVIGGTSLFGGRGAVTGTVIACFVLAIITNILNLMGVHPFPQQIAKGAIIIGGILMQRLVERDTRQGRA